MKKFRISYTICEGGNEYADKMIVEAERLVNAIKYCGFSMIGDDYRGIKDLYVEEIRPVIVTVEGGRILSIDNIPQDIVIEVRDFDVDDPAAPNVRKSGESGDLYLESVWESR